MQVAIIDSNKKLSAIMNLEGGMKFESDDPDTCYVIADEFETDDSAPYCNHTWIPGTNTFDVEPYDPGPTIDEIVARKVAEILAASGIVVPENSQESSPGLG